MTQFTIADLTRMLRECAGEDESVDLDGNGVLDADFADLGYDSLALFNTVIRIEQECGVKLADNVVDNAKSPRVLLDEVNARLQRTA